MLARLWSAPLLGLLLVAACSDDDDGPRPDKGRLEAGVDQGPGKDAVGDLQGDGPKGEASVKDGGLDGPKADGPKVDGSVADAAEIIEVSANLSGVQVVPAVSTSASGKAELAINGTKTAITVKLEFSGLSNITASHIHVGEPGVEGPVIFALAGGTFTSPLSKTLTAADLTAQPGQGVASFADAVSAILGGKAYVNIHTTAHPAGEIRGQIGAVELKSAMLGGAQENPPVTTSASGGATVTINPRQTAITVSLTHSGLTGITASHIHVGNVGANGPVIFTLAAGTFTSPLSKTLTASDLTAQPGQGVTSFADAVNAILGGRTYVNIHTTAHPGGEIRGQLGAINLKATLAGAQEVPPVTTSASGSAAIRINPAQTELSLTLAHSGLTSITGSHIHVGVAGANGPVIFALAGGPFGSPLSKGLKQADLTAQPGQGVTSFAEAVNAILGGRAYVNIHTQGHPGGEIRGQIGP